MAGLSICRSTTSEILFGRVVLFGRKSDFVVKLFPALGDAVSIVILEGSGFQLEQHDANLA